MHKILLVILLVMSTSTSTLCAHADTLGKADAAVANILFEYDGANEFATYRVNESGFVDIVFARNMPDALYSEILDRLQNHPDIQGVLAGKGGPACPLF